MENDQPSDSGSRIKLSSIGKGKPFTVAPCVHSLKTYFFLPLRKGRKQNNESRRHSWFWPRSVSVPHLITVARSVDSILHLA